MLKKIAVLSLVFALAGFGTLSVEATEITGTLSTAAGGSDQNGTLVATVSQGSGQGNSGNDETAGGSGSSRIDSSRRAGSGGFPTTYDPIIIIDTIPSQNQTAQVAGTGSGGTGGGFDPELEAFLNASEEGLSPEEAVAFNNAQNPLANTDLIAATESGIGSAKVWTAVVLGIALLGLAGYAVNALIAYRRENDL